MELIRRLADPQAGVDMDRCTFLKPLYRNLERMNISGTTATKAKSMCIHWRKSCGFITACSSITLID